MTWNLTTIGQFYESQSSNPAEYNKLAAFDPVGRMWAALRTAETTYRESLAERNALGVGEISIIPARTEELEGMMRAALATRTAMLNGLESACQALNAHGGLEEPRTSYMQHRLAYLKRTKHDLNEQAQLGRTMAALDAICISCFT